MGKTYTSAIKWSADLDKKLWWIPYKVGKEQNRLVRQVYGAELNRMTAGKHSQAELTAAGHPYARSKRSKKRPHITRGYITKGRGMKKPPIIGVAGHKPGGTKKGMKAPPLRGNKGTRVHLGSNKRIAVNWKTGHISTFPVLPMNRQSGALRYSQRVYQHGTLRSQPVFNTGGKYLGLMTGKTLTWGLGFENRERYFKFILLKHGTQRQIPRPLRLHMWKYITTGNALTLRLAQRDAIRMIS